MESQWLVLQELVAKYIAINLISNIKPRLLTQYSTLTFQVWRQWKCSNTDFTDKVLSLFS